MTAAVPNEAGTTGASDEANAAPGYAEVTGNEETRATSTPDTTKITATLPNDVVDDLRELAKERHLTLSAALREAITTSKFISDETKGNGKLLIEKGDGELRQIVFR